RMMGVGGGRKPEVHGGRIQPLEGHGVKLMSLGFLVERDAPAIWRGPIIMKVIQQFLREVAWGELDYFLIDVPPGTGAAQRPLQPRRADVADGGKPIVLAEPSSPAGVALAEIAARLSQRLAAR